MTNAPSPDTVRLASVVDNPRNHAVASLNDQMELKLRFSQLLQSTLDLSTLFQLFFKNVGDLLPLRSLCYLNPQLPEPIYFGKKARHTGHYQLMNATNEQMGELTFSFSKRFNAYELELLETLISCLILPLRNTLMYQTALQAAMLDPLTGVGNRLAMDSTLDREINMARRYDHALSILVIDIDRFKSINDRFGHSSGDEILKIISEQLLLSSRTTDLTCRPFRFGGEEFVMLLNNTDKSGAAIAAERIRNRIENITSHIDEHEIKFTVSIGVACLRRGDNRQSLFKRADSALYQAKNKGRNQVVIIDDADVAERRA